MFRHLHIQDPRERWIVGVADAALSVAAGVGRLWPWSRPVAAPRRILLLRLERIGDLLMTLDAIAAVRALAPTAEIDLVVGSWNAPLARLIAAVNRVETLDASWLARDGAGVSVVELMRRALAWRRRRYDLAINFEGDVRSNLLLALSGAARRVGFDMAGGGPALTERVGHRPREHTSANVMRLVGHAFEKGKKGSDPFFDDLALRKGGLTPFLPSPFLPVPEQARRDATRLLAGRADRRPLIGVHSAGGREVKQWAPERLAEVATRLARERGATIVLTGDASDRALVDRVKALLDPAPGGIDAIDVAGNLDLVALAALLERLDLFITADTGPMHLAAAVGTPIVAIFGPSDPARYGPLTARSRNVRVDLPCSPCNRVRTPPERCVGHVPDCLLGVSVEQVLAAARELLDEDEARLKPGTTTDAKPDITPGDSRA